MCGIWLVLCYEECTLGLIKDFEKIKHRGPDSYRIEGIPGFVNSCVGFHRLAIIGNNSSMQPISNLEYPHLLLACNGEIYNYKTLNENFQLNVKSQSDTECILHLYERFGVDKMASYIDGMFAMVLTDTLRGKAYLIRDPLGIRPLYFIKHGKSCIIAGSEAKSLTDLAKTPDCTINVVLPGSIIEIDVFTHGALICDKRSYYKLGDYPLYLSLNSITMSDDVYTNVRSLLKNAVRKRLQSERKICCLLSGGIDSSIVAGLICELLSELSLNGNYQKLETFSVGMNHDSVDLINAKKVAKHLGTVHHEVIFTFEDILEHLQNIVYTQETFDSASIRAGIGLYFLCRFVKANSESVVVFTGEGSDELTYGYEHFHQITDPQESENESDRLLNNLHYFDVRRCDMLISKWGMEGRVPFLDHTFVAYYRSLDPTLKQPRNGIEKYVLRKAFESENFLPHDVLWRPKIPFSCGLKTEGKLYLRFHLDEYFNSQISDSEFVKMKSQICFLPPETKQDLQIRKYFEEFFPGQNSISPLKWK